MSRCALFMSCAAAGRKTLHESASTVELDIKGPPLSAMRSLTAFKTAAGSHPRIVAF